MNLILQKETDSHFSVSSWLPKVTELGSGFQDLNPRSLGSEFLQPQGQTIIKGSNFKQRYVSWLYFFHLPGWHHF